MRSEIIQYLDTRPDLKEFIRSNPSWYRKLSRDPLLLSEIEMAAKEYYGLTFGQKLQRIQERIETAAMMMELMKAMGTKTE